MTRFEKTKFMNIDEISIWLDKYGQFDTAPWTVWFADKYCDNCESIMCHYEDSEYEFPCAWCELNDGCKFFPEMDEVPDNKAIIKLWLESEVNNEERT